MNAKDTPGETLKGNDEHTIGNWRKGEPCHEVVETWLNCAML